MKRKIILIIFFYIVSVLSPSFLFISREDYNLFLFLKEKYPLLDINKFEHIDRNSKIYKIDTFLICAVINFESHWKLYAKSNKGAKGLMQLMKVHKPKHCSIKDLYRPMLNIELGCKHLYLCKDKDLSEQLRKYNQGQNAKREEYRNWRYIDNILFEFEENKKLYAEF